MWTLYKQEVYKLIKKKSTLWITAILILTEIGAATISHLWPKTLPAQMMFVSDFHSAILVVFFSLAIAASTVTMEFQYGTIKTVLAQKYSREYVLISKWLLMLTYTLYLYVMTMVMALFLKLVLVNGQFSLVEKGWKHQFWQDWLAAMGAHFITLWVLISLVLLIATAFKTSSVAISVGIIGYFVLNLTSAALFSVIAKYPWLKWNPLNFLNYDHQIVAEEFSKFTKLTDNQLLLGDIGYIALFLLIGILIFRKRSV